MSKLRRILRAVAGITIGSILALLCAEILISLVWSRPAVALGVDLLESGLFQRDADCGWRMTPSIEVDHRLHWGESVKIRTNAAGFRDLELDPNDSRPRVLVIGDSFAFGFGVAREDSFPARLQLALPNHRVINHGQTGYNLAQSRALLERSGLALHPKTVVLSLCMNDVEEQHIPTARAAAPVPHRPGIKGWLMEHSALYLLTRQVLNQNKSISRAFISLGLRDRLAGYEALDPALRPFLIDEPDHLVECWDKTFAELDRIHQLCDSISAELLVALIPARQTLDAASLETTISYVDFDRESFDFDKGYDRFLQHCVERGIQTIHATPEFAAAIETGAELFLPRDMHFNPAGNSLFASLAARALAP